MKKKLFVYLTSLFTALLFLSGCQKDIQVNDQQIDKEDSGPAESLHAKGSGNDGKCRLTQFLDSDGQLENYHYNNRGLCDEWSDTKLGLLKQEYNAAGRLVKCRWYDGEDLIYTIQFFYTGKNVTKEIWYSGDSQDIDDEVFYTHSSRGEILRMESFIYDYYTVYRYDGAGNVKAWDFYSDGLPTYSAVITFDGRRNYKNPRRAIAGIEYGFPYLNGAIFTSPFAVSSEKVSVFDEDGNPVVYWETDPQQTSYQPASQNYPASGMFFELVANSWYSQTFEYENCGQGSNATTGTKQPTTSAAPAQAGSRQALMKIMTSRGKELRKNIMEMRRQLNAVKR